MSFLLPLGFLGLLGIGALILIYIIRPNYQQKFVTSTYVWKLSLKYKKKNLPINRIRNILIFLCQLLILIACALLLARPVIPTEKTEVHGEKIAIIDASASMRVSLGEISRFERAVGEVKTLAQQSADSGELISIILADGDAHYLVQRSNGENYADTVTALDALLDGDTQCSYGSADMEGAVSLAEEVVAANPDSEVLLYTATTYIDKGGIKVVDVSLADEWNVAVLNCNAEVIDNFYEVTTDIGCYGKSQQVTVYCDMFGVNGTDRSFSMSKTEQFNSAEPEHTFVFDKEDHITNYGEYIYSCESIHVYVRENDSFADDNSFYVYGGIKPVIKVQYVSSVPCQFFRNMLLVLRNYMKDKWTVQVTEVTELENSKTEGYDLYIYEHVLPATMPTDGVVLCFDPPASGSTGLDIEFRTTPVDVPQESTLGSGKPHVITQKIDPDSITISRYLEVRESIGYEELLFFQGSPVLLVKEEQDFKYVVFTFDVHRSSLPVNFGFPQMFLTIFNTYIPTTASGNLFRVGDTVELNARANLLNFSGPGVNELYESFPKPFTLSMPGTYTLTQMIREEILTESFFVGVPAYESNIKKEVDALPILERTKREEETDWDLLIYFAAALVALLFAEWWLQSRENLR